MVKETSASDCSGRRRFYERDRLRPIPTSASSFFRVQPIRLRPISTSANFASAIFDFGKAEMIAAF